MFAETARWILFGYRDGGEWFVAHTLFNPRGKSFP
jgi:hypothetical protein